MKIQDNSPGKEKSKTLWVRNAFQLSSYRLRQNALNGEGGNPTLRYSILRREMSNITDAVLAAALKELLADGIIIRRQFNEIPPHVE